MALTAPPPELPQIQPIVLALTAPPLDGPEKRLGLGPPTPTEVVPAPLYARLAWNALRANPCPSYMILHQAVFLEVVRGGVPAPMSSLTRAAFTRRV